MPYAKAFSRYSFLHVIAGTQEIGVTDLSVSNPTGVYAPNTSEDAIGDIAELYRDMITNTAFGFADYGEFLGVKWAPIGSDGSYLGDPVFVELTPHGVGASNNVPAQCSVVLSLRSGSNLGKGNYGRMFLPYCRPVQPVGSPYIDGTRQSAMLSAAKTFLDGVNTRVAALDPSSAIVIMSEATGQPTKAVTTVGSGKVIDTQRRRRNALDEGYVFATLA